MSKEPLKVWDRRVTKSSQAKQPNDLTTAIYTLTKGQKRLLHLLMAKITQAKKEGVELDCFTQFEINYGEYQQIYGKRNSLKREFLAIRTDFFGRGEIQGVKQEGNVNNAIHTFDGRIIKSSGQSSISILSSITVEPKNKRMLVMLSQVFFKFIWESKGNNFTSYFLRNIVEIKSPKYMRLVELISQWQFTTNKLNRKLEFWFMFLDLPESYHSIGNLNKFVIAPAIKEINEKTDFDISFELKCLGDRSNTVTHLELSWVRKETENISMTESEAQKTYFKITKCADSFTVAELENFRQHLPVLMERFDTSGDFFALFAQAQLKAAECEGYGVEPPPLLKMSLFSKKENDDWDDDDWD